MQTIEKKKRYTVDDYMLLEEGAPFQLIKNDLVMSPSPNTIHQAMVVRLSHIILGFLEKEHVGGYTAVSMDVVFDENNVFQPDFLFVLEERVDKVVKSRIEGTPDLVIEILSPSNAYYDLRQKKDIYEKYGVTEYIIFDPMEKSGELYMLNNRLYQLNQKKQNVGMLHSLVLPGLQFDLNYIFK